jgi:hypothetical protein
MGGDGMKWFFWVLIFLAFFTPIIFTGKGIDHLDIMKDRYKRALDAGVSSAAHAVTYENEEGLRQTGMGFGTQQQNANNIPVDRERALAWFYKVFYRNLGMEKDTASQQSLGQYIPMKAIAGFDRLMIADVHDNWVLEEYYDIRYGGQDYRFTLSDQVMNKATGTWGRDVDFGIHPAERRAIVSGFIKKKLNSFLENRENRESNYNYEVNISAQDFDVKTDNIQGISFIVMVEGLPLPTLNPWKTERFYAFSLGGTEIRRQ